MSDSDSVSAIPLSMQWRFKEIKKVLKQTVRMVPTSSQGTVSPGNRIVVELPANSLVDLNTFCMYFKGATSHAGAPTGVSIYPAATDYGGALSTAQYVQSYMFPRNTASLIENLTIKVNGQIRFNVPNYNLLWNILHDYTQGQQGLYRRAIGENSDPSNKKYVIGNDIVERRGYASGAIIPNELPTTSTATASIHGYDVDTYIIRSWLGLLGNASTNVIDTNILGTVSIEITLAPGSCLIKSTLPTAGTVSVANATPILNSLNRTVWNAACTATAAATAALATNGNYSLTDVTFTICRYDMPSQFYEGEAQALASGKTFKLWFPNYSVFTGTTVLDTNKSCTNRFSIATRSLDFVLSTFRPAAYDTSKEVLNTLRSNGGLDTSYGNSAYTFDNLVNNGARRAFNNSIYYARNGDSITQCTYTIGNTRFPTQTLSEQYSALLEHYNIQNDCTTGMYPGINSLGAFRECFYSHMLSLNVADPEMYTVSGLDSQETPIQIQWQVEATAFTPITANNSPIADNITTGGNAQPIMIAGYSSHLEISGGRQILTVS